MSLRKEDFYKSNDKLSTKGKKKFHLSRAIFILIFPNVYHPPRTTKSGEIVLVVNHTAFEQFSQGCKFLMVFHATNIQTMQEKCYIA